MKCPKCGFDNVDEATYCINCGSRIDGNILCPKCSEVISPDSDVCPKCGKKIPHNIRDSSVKNAKKAKLVSVFNRVSSIIILICLFIGLVFVWGKYVTIKGEGPQFYGYSFYYLFLSWNEMITNLKDSAIVSHNASIISGTIIQFLLVALNIATTYIFGIMGIRSALQNIKKNTQNRNIYVYLAIILVSNLFVSRMLGSSILTTCVSYQSYSFGSIDSFIALCSLTIVSVSILSIISSFDKRRIILFVERLVFLLSFIFILVFLSLIGKEVLITDVPKGSSTVFFELLRMFMGRTGDEYFVLSFVTSLLLIVFKLIVYFSLGTLIIFYATGFFSKREYSMRYKIPCYALSLTLFISTIIMMILNIVLVFYLNKITYIYNPKISQVTISPYLWLNVSLSFLTLGGSVVSLALSRTYNHNQRLADKTTIK